MSARMDLLSPIPAGSVNFHIKCDWRFQIKCDCTEI